MTIHSQWRTSPLFILCLLLIAEGGGYYYLYRQPSAAKIISKSSQSYRFPRPEQELVDFSYQVSRAGSQIYSLKGHKLIIQKKKIGFFRFGLLKEAVIEHANFELTSSWENSVLSGENRYPPGDITHDVGFVFSGQKVSSLVCMPISFTVNLDGPAGGKALIEADRADLLADGRMIRFQGNVRLSSCSMLLESNELEFYPAGYRIAVARAYTLVTEQKRMTGHGVESDVFLHALSGKNQHKGVGKWEK